VRHDSEKLVAELCHEINSPLAAVRNALYLVACRTTDDEIHRYLQIAESEVVNIANVLRDARQQTECQFYKMYSRSNAA
jgi:signal transduction histidine kinase